MYLLYRRPPVWRPIWLGSRLGLLDMQGAIPRGWCANCGTELFIPDTELCQRCKKEEEKHVREELSKSL